MQNNFHSEKELKQLEARDRETEEYTQLYSHGKTVYARLNEIDSKDMREIEFFFDSLNEYDNKALDYYNNILLHTPKPSEQSLHSPQVKQPPASTPIISSLLEEFITEKSRNWGEKQADSTENKDYRPKLNLFIEIIGDKNGNEIQTSDIVSYKKAMFKLPKNRNKKKPYKVLSIPQILNLEIPKKDILNDSTIQNHFSKISTFLRWCSDNKYSESGLHLPLKRVIRSKKRAHEERDIFTAEDLTKLFNNDYYEKLEFRELSQYWIPLLGLLTGARENELCQLYVEDIQKLDGIDIISINDKKDKRIKTISAKRQIPIHSILLEKFLFLDFVKNMKDKGESRLFPNLPHSRDGHAAKFSKWFNRTYRKNIGVGILESEKKDFHSFRHTIIDFFKQAGIEEHRVAELVGQSSNKGITFDRYGKPMSLKSKKELVEAFHPVSVNFNKIRIWKE